MRLVFVGATRFGLRCLELARGLPACEVVGVVTAPERFAISYRPEGVVNMLYADVPRYCRERDLPFTVIDQGMKGEPLFETVRSWKPDALLVVGWYHMIPKRWRELAPAYGLHASLLPDYSGGAPLVWAIINGERRTGITFFQMTDGVDNGPILAQAATGIQDHDTIATLYARIEDLGLGLIADQLPVLARGEAKPVPQDESRRRVFPQRAPADGVIDWSRGAAQLYDFVRAQTRPYPGAFTTWRGQRVTIWSATAHPGDAVAAAAGTVVAKDGRLLVQAGGGTLELTEVEIDGRVLGGADLAAELAGAGVLGA